MNPKSGTDVRNVRLPSLGGFVDGSPAVVFLWRIEPEGWPAEMASSGVERLLGYTPEDFTSGRVMRPGIMHPEDFPGLEREGDELLAAGRNEWSREYRLIAKDGRTVWVQDWNRVIRDANGRPIYVLALVSDITGSKRGEHLLRLQRDLLLALGQARNLPETLQTCLDAAFEVSGMECGGIYLTDDTGALRLAASKGITGEFAEAAAYYPADATNTRLVMAGQPVYAGRAEMEVRFGLGERLDALHTLAVVPIRHEQRILGCMNVASHALDDVPPHSRWSLETIASTVGLLIARAQTEEALRESESRFRSLVESSMDAVLLGTPDGRICSANEAACRMFGRSEQELIQAGRSAVLDASDPRLAAALEERARTGKFRGELTFLRRDGTRFPCEISSVSFTDRHDEVRTGIAIRDITDRKQAEVALRESEERFRLFMDNSPTIAWIKDEHGRYVYLSHTYEDRFRVRLEDWRGRTDAELWPAEVAGTYRRNDRAVLEAGHAIELVEETIDADGSCRYWLTSKFPFRDAAGNRYIAGIGLDITGRKQAEEALSASREQMRALAARLQAVQEEERRRMARAVHDEIGQSVAALGMVLHEIESKMERMTPDPIIGALTDRIVNASDMVKTLGRTAQRLAAGLRSAVLDQLGLVSALRREAEAFQRRSGVTCRIEAADDAAGPSSDAATALFRIFQEAMTNVALHARARTASVHFGLVEGAWQLDILDDGRGIEAGEPSRPDALGQIGMRERAEACGGTFAIERRLEGGTALRVRIPAGNAEGSAQ